MKAFGTSCDPLAFVNGFCVTSPSGARLVIKAVNFVCISDWDQHAKSFSLKGPNGSTPNVAVKNLEGRCAEFVHEYRVHVFSPEYEKLDYHTPESFIAGVDELKTIFDSGNNAQLKRRQQGRSTANRI